MLCVECGDECFEDVEDNEEEEDEEEDEEEEDMEVVDDDADVYTQILQFIDTYSMDVLFPPLDGAAFYKRICKINHSCEPNVRVSYVSTPEGGLTVDMIALREIREGEELVQSYIDQNMCKLVILYSMMCVVNCNACVVVSCIIQ